MLDGAKILRECWNFDESAKIYRDILVPLYDNEDSVCGIIYNDEPYYFQKNLQGDIIGIVDNNSTIVARYSYDAWGVSTIAQDSTDCAIATINPFRYRSYYFDQGTNLYYLQSRYYNAEIGRFVNVDDAVIVQVPTGNAIHTNLYSYCNNNPVSLQDESGYITPANVIGAIVGAGAGALIGLAIANYFRLTGWKKWLVVAGSSALVAVAGWFAGPAIYKAIKPVLQKAVEAGRLAISKISTTIAKLLRLVNPNAVKFAKAASKHQGDPARRVPLTHLVNVIKSGAAKADPRGSKAIMYTIKNFWKNGKEYKLEVLYDWSTKTIYHFKYWR